MKEQSWIFSARYWDGSSARDRFAVVGPACASTVEAALHLAAVPEDVRAEIRGDAVVRDFVEGRLDPDKTGYYVPAALSSSNSWIVCIGSVQEVLR